MNTFCSGREMLGVLCGVLVLGAVSAMPTVATGGVKVFESADQSLELGLRLQPRMELERVGALGGGTDRDFIVRRARIKANGKMKNAAFTFEWKIDGTDQIGASPSAAVENGYVQCPLGRGVDVRAGLYDQPFSRDRLTSDSKQLAVDRGEVSNVPDASGLADNVVGVQLMGKVNGGRAQYTVGLFDNRFIPGKLQDIPMVCGRLDLNLGSMKDIFQDAHFGTESWYSIGLNASYQKIDAYAAADSFTNSAGGVDGMVDIPFGQCRVFVKGELNAVRKDWSVGTAQDNVTARMLAAGVLVLDQRLQPFVRFDQVRGAATLPRGGRRDITFVGANFYQKGHNLKFQGDVRLQANTKDSVDGARLQAQVDF